MLADLVPCVNAVVLSLTFLLQVLARSVHLGIELHLHQSASPVCRIVSLAASDFDVHEEL